MTEFGAELAGLIDDMLETMYSDDGIGLAAPQIGVQQRVIVIESLPFGGCLEDGR